MSDFTKLEPESVGEIAESHDIGSTTLIIEAIADGIITGDSYVGRASDTQRVYHLAGSERDFQVYVERLALRLRDGS